MKKTVIYLIGALVVLIIFLVVAKKKGWLGEAEGLEVETAQVERGTIVESVIATGKVRPEVEVKISPEVSGEIIELPVREGQRVEKGDLLARINPDLFQAAVSRTEASVNSARASLASAEAQYLEAQRNFKRNKSLHEKEVISDSEFDAARRAHDVAQLNVESARYQLVSAQASLKEARDNLRRTTIYAPQDATISSLDTEVGERVVGTAQMAGTEMMRLANLEHMEVVVEVNENDIIRVEKGDTALIDVEAYFDEEFKGVVTQMANSAKSEEQSLDQVTNFEVKVRILPSSYQHLLSGDSAQTPFRPGMTASVEILTKQKDDIIRVPIQAVTTRADTSGTTGLHAAAPQAEGEALEVVFRYKDGKALLQEVKTGIQDDTYIEIVEGLEAEQSIITGPYSVVSKRLKNGSEVLEKPKK